MKKKIRKILTIIGALTSARIHHKCQAVVNYLKIGRWMTDHGFQIKQRVANRDAVFATVAERISNARVLYLEFGVWKGASMRCWSGALKHPDAKLHGFDSFEGLPEDFDDVGGPLRKRAFDVGGRIPEIEDPRIRFFKGWFHETLPTYQVPEHDRLVINLDADIYSSTIYVLRHLREHIKPGTFTYFDEMSRLQHEPKAFAEFMEETGLRFELVATDESLNRVFFECVA